VGFKAFHMLFGTGGNAIASVLLFVRLFLLLSFEPTDLWPWSFACLWVTAMDGSQRIETEGHRSRSSWVGYTSIFDGEQFSSIHFVADCC